MHKIQNATAGCSNCGHMTMISYLRHHFFFKSNFQLSIDTCGFVHCGALNKRPSVFTQFRCKTCLQWFQNTYRNGAFLAPPAIYRKENSLRLRLLERSVCTVLWFTCLPRIITPRIVKLLGGNICESYVIPTQTFSGHLLCDKTHVSHLCWLEASLCVWPPLMVS